MPQTYLRTIITLCTLVEVMCPLLKKGVSRETNGSADGHELQACRVDEGGGVGRSVGRSPQMRRQGERSDCGWIEGRMRIKSKHQVSSFRAGVVVRVLLYLDTLCLDSERGRRRRWMIEGSWICMRLCSRVVPVFRQHFVGTGRMRPWPTLLLFPMMIHNISWKPQKGGKTHLHTANRIRY